MSKSLLGCLFMLLFAFTARAEQPIFNISSATANPGEIVEIDFRVNDFTDIILAQFTISWNPSVLEFVEIRNLNTGVNGLSVSSSFNLVDFLDEGDIPFVWFEPSTNPVTLPDGTLLFTLAFEVIGAPCQSSLVDITGEQTEIEVAESDQTEVGLVANPGEVNIPGVGCSQDLTFTGTSVTGTCGSEACVSFTVENFTNVASMDFALVFDPTVIAFDRFQNYGPLATFGSGSTNLAAPGLLRVVWSNPNAENESLPDGTVLFEICFDVLGPGGQSSTITFGNNPPVEIADNNSNIYNVDIVPASITAECAIEGFALIAENTCTEPNGITCIDISVNDFEDIISMQFSINWDPSIFVFDHIENLNLPELTMDLFGLPPDIPQGQLSLSWFTIGDGVTVPDLSTIFTLCLRAVGPAGSASPVTFSDIPSEIEITTEDSLLVFGLINAEAQIKVNCDDPCAISYLLTPISPGCPGQSNGGFDLNMDLGECSCIPTFQWSNGLTTEDISGVPAGTYTVTITLCDEIAVASGTINNPLAIEATGTVSHPFPPNPNSGAINLEVSGGTPPYTYLWSHNNATTEDLSGIPAGTYTVTITDARGCTFIPDPFVLGGDLTAFVTHATCGECNGSIALSPSFGNPPYTYIWNTSQTSPTLSDLCGGTYCVTITSSGGATRDTCFTVTQTNINVTANVIHDTNENCTGAIDLTVLGAMNPISYDWSNGAMQPDIIGLCGGTYCVTITYGAGCSFDTCFTVFTGNIGLDLNVKQYGDFQISCGGECDGEITPVIFGAVPPVSYSWSNGSTAPALSDLCAGIYSLTITDGVGKTASSTTTITAPPALTYTVIKTDPSDVTSSDGSIAVIATGGVPPYTYEWVGPVTGNTAAMNNLPAGTYQITVIDDNGCEFTDNIELKIEGVPCYQANKIITPNDDGRNDFFVIQCIFDADNRLFIFNRYGGLVYETNNYTNNWTGVDEDNEPLADGGYMWVLEIDLPSGPRILKGTINVLRTAD